ncbi:helix-turn-helix domain-containing protein [Pseudoalteromonas carrageenovora]|uniref:helix-turn-helix domain-containing protein n=1 Tax=Pseudoalteromonas carrageenovora TaxID=227 RepID=UPI00311F4769
MTESIALLVFFTHLLVAVFLLNIHSGNQLSNKILAVFLLITALDISNFIFSGFYGDHLNLDMFRANFSALLAPTLYFYVKSIIYSDLKLKTKDLLHAIPFIIICLIFIPRFHLADDIAKMSFYNNHEPLFEVLFVHVVLYLQMFFYLALIFKKLNRYKLTVLNNYSNIEILNKQWLNNFMMAFLIDFTIVLARNIIKFTELQGLLNLLTPLMMTVTLFFVCWILWQALHKPLIFQGISSKVESLEPKKLPQNPSEDVIVDANEAQRVLSTIKCHMSLNKPYLNPSLNIDTLAKQLNIPALEISTVLNHHLGQHFFDFINSYRVNEAANILSLKSNKQKAILEILLEVGFNSKSSFNTAFKKHLTVTPSQYRKERLND